jgi:class 3 adenylate cyclase
MPDIAAPVLEYIYDLTVKDLSPAFLLVEQSGVIRYWGGNLEIYGINGLKEGDLTEDHAEFLRGFFPFEDEQLNLSCVETESGVSADVHIFRAENGYWVLLLDVTGREEQQSVTQQRINEICLIRDRYAKMIDQYLGKEIAEELLRPGSREQGESRYVSLLAANIRGLGVYSRQHSSQEVFNLLNACLSAMILPVLEEKGTVDKMGGQGMIAIFGITGSETSPSLHSVRAGMQIIKNLCALRKTHETRGEYERIDIGIGIASGHVFWGIMGSRNRRTLSIAGHNVYMASLLENQARSNEILIDTDTFGQLGALQSRFRSVSLKLREIEDSLQVFSCESDERG